MSDEQRVGTLRDRETGQVVEGVDVLVFMSEIQDPANWEGDGLWTAGKTQPSGDDDGDREETAS